MTPINLGLIIIILILYWYQGYCDFKEQLVSPIFGIIIYILALVYSIYNHAGVEYIIISSIVFPAMLFIISFTVSKLKQQEVIGLGDYIFSFSVGLLCGVYLPVCVFIGIIIMAIIEKIIKNRDNYPMVLGYAISITILFIIVYGIL